MPDAPSEHSAPTLLVLDDEPMIPFVLTRMIGTRYRVIAFTSCREVLSQIESGVRFDVLLCDMIMPEMTGAEFYDELLVCAPDQARRVIFMTGGAYTEEARIGLSRAPNGHLEKPFDLNVLREKVDAVLSRADH